MHTPCTECKKLQARIDYLEDELFKYQQKQRQFELDCQTLKVHYNIAKQVAAVLLVLYHAKDRFTSALSITDQINTLHFYGHMTDNADFNQARVIVNKLNNVLGQSPKRIESEFRVGYRLKPDLFNEIKQILKESNDAKVDC